MASNALEKCISVGERGIRQPYSDQDVDFNAAFVADTGTRWIKIWAPWDYLQPTPNSTLNDPAILARWLHMDRQIQSANQRNIGVILTLSCFPTWSNGQAPGSPTRIPANHPLRTKLGGGEKGDVERLPTNFGPGSPWATFLTELTVRYHRANTATSSTRPVYCYVNAIEIVNEPNTKYYPINAYNPATDFPAFPLPGPAEVSAANKTAQMFRTAQQIQLAFTNPGAGVYAPLMAGPATLDLTGNSDTRRDYLDFMTDLFAALPLGTGFQNPQGRFLWTIHNYQDMLHDHGPGSTAPDAGSNPTRASNRARTVGTIINVHPTYEFYGVPGQRLIWSTEGGVRLSDIRTVYGITDPTQLRNKQAELTARCYNRFADTSQGHNIGGYTTYLNFSDLGFDSGLREPLDVPTSTGGQERPAYTFWKNLPSIP